MCFSILEFSYKSRTTNCCCFNLCLFAFIVIVVLSLQWSFSLPAIPQGQSSSYSPRTELSLDFFSVECLVSSTFKWEIKKKNLWLKTILYFKKLWNNFILVLVHLWSYIKSTIKWWLKQQKFFLTVLETWKSKSKHSQIWCLQRTRLLVYRWPSLCVPTWRKGQRNFHRYLL